MAAKHLQAETVKSASEEAPLLVGDIGTDPTSDVLSGPVRECQREHPEALACRFFEQPADPSHEDLGLA